ncbi:SDR family oxidoreductase [Virgibacillus xinjiangensis]|uniref:SDR family oxidoreductase n=1 Tax=Virgibacillus xinjiangensis TaxID=393090 RepID=A0ABV7CZM6_9BACI
MKTLIVGANGKIGKHLVRKIVENGQEARAMIRKEEQASYFEDLGAETVVVDLEDSVESIQKAVEGVDAVVFTAGSGPNTGKDKTILIDLDGAVKTVEAARAANVERFVLVSSFDTSREAIVEAPSSFSPYVAAKRYADVALRNSGLSYTIVHPGILTNDDATGKVSAAEKVQRGEVPREDVAEVLYQTLQTSSTIGKAFQVVSGDTPVKEAVESL